jgi:hypothetical protein
MRARAMTRSTRRFTAAMGLLVAAVSCAATPNGAGMTSTTAGASAQDDNQTLTLRPLPIEASAIDGLQLVDTPDGPMLLYSTQSEQDGRSYALVIRALTIGDAPRSVEVARIPRLLPVPPQWDARPAGAGWEVVYEVAGGAVNWIERRDAQGNVTNVSAEYPIESFTRPHFVKTGGASPDIGAVVDLQRVVVFPGGARQAVKYVVLAEGADGLVGGATERWVVSKNMMSGIALFDAPAGRLTISRGAGGAAGRSLMVPDLIVHEIAADDLGGDVLVFATGRPAVLIAGRRPDRPYAVAAENRSWLLQLSRPTLLVTADRVHVAAVANPLTGQAQVVYGSVPLRALAP